MQLPEGHSSCLHFSLNNPRGRHEGNLPMILDMTLSDEITENGSWFSVTVYYSLDGWADRE